MAASARQAKWQAAAIFLAAGALGGLAASLGSGFALLALAPLAPAFIAALVAALHLGYLAREAEEAAEREAASRQENRLFEDEATFLDARRSRVQFERFAVPLLALVQTALLVFLARWAGGLEAAASRTGQELFLVALLAAVAFAAFLAGRVVAALAEEQRQPLLHPAADWLLLTAVVAVLAGGALLAGREELGWPAEWLVRGVAALLWLLAVEQVALLGLEAYRARAAGVAARPVSESRLLRIALRPSRLAESIAATLDYQFGWQISSSAVYAAATGALAPLAGFWAASLWLLSAVVFIEPHQAGLLERCGAPVGRPLGPGPHLVWPWPVDRVRRVDVGHIHELAVGVDVDHLERHGAGAAVVWSEDHHGHGEPFLTASPATLREDAAASRASAPVGLVSAAILVNYRIADPVRHAYGFVDPEAALTDAVWRETTRLMLTGDLEQLTRERRRELGERLTVAVRAAAARLDLGLAVRQVSLRDVHPPLPVMPAFLDVASAGQQAAAEVLAAESVAVAAPPAARAEAAVRLAQGRAEAVRITSEAAGRAAWFAGAEAAVAAQPEVYKLRRWTEQLREVLAGRPKVIDVAGAAGGGGRVFDLTSRTTPDLLDLPLPDPEEAANE